MINPPPHSSQEQQIGEVIPGLKKELSLNYISISMPLSSLSAGIFLPTAENTTHPRTRNDKCPWNRKANASLLPVDHTS